jgi:hypothetical protein
VAWPCAHSAWRFQFVRGSQIPLPSCLYWS